VKKELFKGQEESRRESLMSSFNDGDINEGEGIGNLKGNMNKINTVAGKEQLAHSVKTSIISKNRIQPTTSYRAPH
jgi:hypothetical protein